MAHLFLYCSSAGSGKTRTLAKVYLLLALRYRSDYFRHILAITFTNKATQEMKDRVIRYLVELSSGRSCDLAVELQQDLRMDARTVQERSQEVLRLILHQYGDFSISTIDAFFQRVIRAFAREAGLTGDYRLIIDTDRVLQEVVDMLLADVGRDKDLTRWIIDFALHELEVRQKLDIRQELIEFSRQLIREEFRQIENQLMQTSPQTISRFIQDVRNIQYGFIQAIRNVAVPVLNDLKKAGFSVSDFKYGANGSIFKRLEKISQLQKISDLSPDDMNGGRFSEYQLPENWPSSRCDQDKRLWLINYAENMGIPQLNKLRSIVEKDYAKALTAELVQQHIYIFGLVNYLLVKLRDYRHEHRAMLLADAPFFLKNIINKSDTPFIYEKVGSVYHHFLIDEFQDTSYMQWENLRPLVVNSLDQGYDSMIVGDVKQSIYRWRGGDFSLLEEEVEKQIGRERVVIEPLSTNYRSARNIVRFNNAFFTGVVQRIVTSRNASFAQKLFLDAVQEVHQSDEGYIRIRLLPKKGNTNKWKEEAMRALCRDIETLQLRGVPPRDIAILVRYNREGQAIVNYLMQYRQSSDAREGVHYNVTSAESLRLDRAASVNLLISALQFLRNPDDNIARARLAFEYNRIHHPDLAVSQVIQVTSLDNLKKRVPDRFLKALIRLRNKSLYEITETLVDIFGLMRVVGEAPYLQAFQELVLQFMEGERNDLSDFLTWWNDICDSEKGSLKSATGEHAMQVYTIHKAKGLDFKYVLIPFCGWSLDHEGNKAPIMWASISDEPFDALKVVPVRYNKKMPESFFRETYEKERQRVLIDNLNLLYVAFTRAKQGLFITAPVNEKENAADEMTHTGQLLKSFVDQSPDFRKNPEISEMGDLPSEATDAPDRIPASVPSPEPYETYIWSEILFVEKAEEMTRLRSLEQRDESRQKGKLWHILLAKIHHEGMAEEVVRNHVDAGIISDAEGREFLELFRQWLNNAQFKEWFSCSPEWKIYTEVPVIRDDREEKRFDRLLINKNRAVVIDFKTGESHPISDKTNNQDRQQVLQYMELLRNMHYAEVEGYLFYTADIRVERVFPEESDNKNKRGNNQLSLDYTS
jgi:ATP-dependent helicase/nuclease subunit A